MGEWIKRLIVKHTRTADNDETHQVNVMLVKDILDESPEDEIVE